jgi:glutaredoxin
MKRTHERLVVVIAITLLACSCCCRKKLFADDESVDRGLEGIFSEKAAGEGGGRESGGDRAFTGEKVRVEFYVMSKCPYGAKAQQGMGPVLQKMGQYIDFSQDYIGSEKEGELSCMHGQPECEGNIAQLCAAQHYPDTYFPFVVCMADGMSQIPGNWKSCATDAGLDEVTLDVCISGSEGEKLLRQSMRNSAAREAKGSPTIYIDDVQHKGARTSEALELAVCSALPQGQRPSNCPVIVPVKLTVVTDSRCVDCPGKVERTLKNIRSVFPGVQVETLDWSDAGARKLAKEAKVELLPAFVFEHSLMKSPGWDDFKKHVDSAGGYHVIRAAASSSTFDPTAEICDNGVDDTGDGLVDCDSPGCTSALPCREAIPGRLDLFLMSDCPYCKKVMSAMPAVMSKFESRIELKVHYVTSIHDKAGYEAYSFKDKCMLFGGDIWLCSLHGPAETEENLRSLCVQDLYPKKNRFLDYMACRHEDFGGDWKVCAKSSKMDTADIEKCSTGVDGLSLLKDDHDLEKTLSIKASPTFMWNNKVIELPKQYTVEGISDTLCTHNPGKGCK